MEDPPYPTATGAVHPRKLSLTERQFVVRAIADAMHQLTVLSGMRVTESEIGEPVEEETSHVLQAYDTVAALHLAEHLLGATGATPTPLGQMLGMSAALEKDPRALELYERWLALQRAAG